jgi:hypothetical protein
MANSPVANSQNEGTLNMLDIILYQTIASRRKTGQNQVEQVKVVCKLFWNM